MKEPLTLRFTNSPILGGDIVEAFMKHDLEDMVDGAIDMQREVAAEEGEGDLPWDSKNDQADSE